MIYIVLGMHKSGTTLVAKILHDSGVPMGDFDEALGYDEGNKYEKLENHDLNIEMLGYDYEESSLNILKVIKGPEEVKPETIGKIKDSIENANRQYQDWGFKDPRTCLTYSVWKALIPKHKRIIIFRNPMELWLHYKPKNFLKGFKSLLVCWKALKSWHIHNLEILRVFKWGEVESYVVEYSNLMKDDRYFKALCQFTGRQLRDARKTGLYRSKEKQGDLGYNFLLLLQKWFFSRDVRGLYRELKKHETRVEEALS